ncbi:hypothetical protein [Ktedonospora formicarum]|nr:hypothetical protein [Ktedonospora formicarum]
MQYEDPRDARRAARDAQRASQRYSRDMWRAQQRYRRGRSWGGLTVVFFIFFGIFMFSHSWTWIVAGFIVLAIFSGVMRRSSQNWWGSQQSYYQPPQNQQQTPYRASQEAEQPYYQPYEGPKDVEQPYQPYEQGYQPTPSKSYTEGGSQRQYSSVEYQEQEYEGPQTEYPEQMPPMKQ